MKATNKVSYWLAGTLLLCAFSLAPAQETDSEASAGSEDKPISPLLEASRKQQEQREQGGRNPSRVYTNDDLSRMFGSRPATPPDKSTDNSIDKPATGASDDKQQTQGDWDPLKHYADRDKAKKEHDAKVAEAQANVTDMQAKVQRLEKFVKSTRMVGIYGRQANPDLSRPDLDGAEYAEWGELDNKTRLMKAEQALEAARTELADAQQELESVRRSGP